MPNNLHSMVGCTLTNIEGREGSFEMVFRASNGASFHFFGYENAHTRVEEIVGDTYDLLHTPLLRAYESTAPWAGGTSTFYHFSTIKGTVTIRWLGESNGYYSEEVQFIPYEGSHESSDPEKEDVSEF